MSYDDEDDEEFRRRKGRLSLATKMSIIAVVVPISFVGFVLLLCSGARW